MLTRLPRPCLRASQSRRTPRRRSPRPMPRYHRPRRPSILTRPTLRPTARPAGPLARARTCPTTHPSPTLTRPRPRTRPTLSIIPTTSPTRLLRILAARLPLDARKTILAGRITLRVNNPTPRPNPTATLLPLPRRPPVITPSLLPPPKATTLTTLSIPTATPRLLRRPVPTISTHIISPRPDRLPSRPAHRQSPSRHLNTSSHPTVTPSPTFQTPSVSIRPPPLIPPLPWPAIRRRRHTLTSP